VTPQRLRHLTLDATKHPEGRAHISAASGLVCAAGRAWVVADDDQHLASFVHISAPGALHRLLPGDLPLAKADRKQRKADFETLLWWPATQHLIALGSGSAAGRNMGVMLGVNALHAPRHFSLAPIYEPLAQRLGSINIEGGVVLNDRLLLLNRGHAHGAPNAVASYRISDFEALLAGCGHAITPIALTEMSLGTLDGATWGFTDACALPDGSGWLFCAAAEASQDSVADGDVLGTALGWVDATGRLQALRQLTVPHKVEGIDVQQHADALWVFMVTDADDPAEPSWLLSAPLAAAELRARPKR
jgi:hypothetical protein